MAAELRSAADEVTELQRCIDALVSIQTLAVLWRGQDSSRIVRGLLEVLVSLLSLDFAYAQVGDPTEATPNEMIHLPEHDTATVDPHQIGQVLTPLLGGLSALQIPNPVGKGDINITSVPLRLQEEHGIVVAGSGRADFPTQTDVVILEVATSQAIIALQEARRLNEQRQSPDDRMVAEQLAKLTATNEDLNKELVERKMEKSVFESEGGFRAVLNNSPNPIFLKDMEGRYQFVNKIFEETVHLSQEQIKGKKDEEIFPPEQAAALRAGDLQVQQTGLAMTFEEVPVQGDGRHTSIVQKFPVRDEHGMIYATAGIVIDISERKHAYEELRILKEKLAYEKQYLESEIRSELGFKEIIGQSQPLRVVLRQIEKVAPTDTTVLIQGETGTGKELIARAIHNLSKRRDKTFVKVNCATIPTGLIESELFGHQKGAFTGAIMQKVGRFELAHQGTIFLDEVGEIPLDLQVKLLRVLQEQEFERLGSTRTQHVDIRVLAATNRDLAQMVAEKQFRSDLYYRLNVFPIRVPALVQRREDIPDLVRFFTKKYARQLNKPISRIADATMHALCSYTWPGNIRELENIIERCVILSADETLDLDQPLTEFRANHETLRHATTLEGAERDLIRQTLIECRWVLSGPSGAATKLGIKRTSLQYKMQKLGITRPQSKAET